MKTNLKKRSLLLGSLMAFVITGSAFAADVNVGVGEIKNDEAEISVGKSESFTNAGTVEVAESITVTGKFTNTGEIYTKNLDVTQYSHANTTVDGKIVAEESFIYRGTNDNYLKKPLTADVHTNLLHIVGSATKNQTGFLVESNDVLDDVKNIVIETKGGRTGLTFKGDLEITSNITLTGESDEQDVRLEIEEGSSVVVENLTNEAIKGKVQANGNSKVAINELNITSGKSFTLQGNGAETSTGKFILNNVNVGDGATFLAYADNTWAKPKLEIGGEININLGENAKVDFGANNIEKPDWDGRKINVNAESLTIHAADTSGSSKVYISSNSDIVKNSDKITIIADGSNNTGNAAEDLKNAGDVLVFTTETGDNTHPKPSAGVGATIVQEAGDVLDGASGTVGQDGKIENITIDKNTNVYGILDITTNALMTWRQENNDMNKRLGELRDSTGQHGVWVRMVRGQVDYNSIDNQYNTYQLGYDEKLSADPSWTVGAAVSYTDGSGSFASGTGENVHKSLAFYGSKLNDDGSFIDLIAKYGRLEHEFNVEEDTLSGEYETNGYSISAEYGKRFEKGSGLWFEPQVELSYGKVDDAGYTNKQGNKVSQEDMESLVGRVGFRIGQNIKQGNVYARASYLYDFDGETAVSFIDNDGRERKMEADIGGGWFEVGIGTNLNLSNATHIYFDVEKTYSGDVATPWQWNAGVRYSF